MTQFRIAADGSELLETTLGALSEDAGPLSLCFGNSWVEDRVDAALVSAALIGTLHDRHLEVHVEDADAVNGLVRFGVASALLARPKALTHFGPGAERLDDPEIGMYWTVGSRSTNESLFGSPADEHTVRAQGGEYATFVNPHLSTGADGHSDIVFLVRRWLTRRLQRQAGDLVDAIGQVLDELVVNVQEHAAGVNRPAPLCLVRLSFADERHVRCTVMDNGVGIIASFEQKMSECVEPPARLEELVSGTRDGWDQGRGFGLPRINRIACSHGGSLSVMTGQARLTAGSDSSLAVGTSAFNLDGTLVDVLLPLDD